MRLVETLNIAENVAIIRGYQSDISIDAYLRTNKVAVFPYGSEAGHEVWGSSGAARLAMSRGIPVISSSIPHFRDLPTIKADTPEDIAKELDHLFFNTKAQQDQIDKQLKFIEENSWEKVAKKMLDIFASEVIL
jgi:glycosyltransferase involved in cell wall biosynthesis